MITTTTMRRIVISVALPRFSEPIIVVFSLVLALVLMPAASADDGEGCSVATLRGTYGIQSTGSIVAAGPIGLVAEAGIIKFDGQGGASQTTTVSLNGTILHNRASLSGDYKVKPDCTGDLTLVLPGASGPIMSTFDFVIVDHGTEVRLVNTGAGRVITGNARKQ